jgi:type IV pilus modification protein PilV
MDRGESKREKRGQSGFTILEVLVAISILVVGLLGVASMQVSAIRGNYFSSNTTLALTLAEDKMEELMIAQYDTVATTDEGMIDETGQTGNDFHRTWTVTDDSPITNTKTVTVTVGWQNDDHQVTLTSIRHE